MVLMFAMLGATGILVPRDFSNDKADPSALANRVDRGILAGHNPHQMYEFVQRSRIAQEHRQLVSMLSARESGDLHPAAIDIEEILRLRLVIIAWVHEMEERYHVLDNRRSNLYRFAKTLGLRDRLSRHGGRRL